MEIGQSLQMKICFRSLIMQILPVVSMPRTSFYFPSVRSPASRRLLGYEEYYAKKLHEYESFHSHLSAISDPLIMMETVRSCKEHGVKIGAHPGLPDLQGFGRREMKLSQEELTAITVYQIGALKGFLDREEVPLHHVKPHGSLYGMCCRDYDISKAVFKAVPKGVKVFGLPGTCMEQAAKDLGLEFVAEFYADVKYHADASLLIERKKK